MEMQIPQLRELFELRVGQISSVLAKNPPEELGKIDPMMRGLKGFMFALEGMLRQNELQHMPFTARVELFDRVDQAIETFKSLPESLSSEQALGVLRVMDSLHRLCLQENLMASGLDASKLGRLTVILERKLGEVLDTIDKIGDTGQGHTDKIEQVTKECLTKIQETYKQEANVLASSASVAVESIRSQAETIRQQQAEAMANVEALQSQLRSKCQQCQAALDEQLAEAGTAVAEIRGEQQAVTKLLARAQAHLDSTQATIETMAETIAATDNAHGDLQAKLSEGRDVIGSIHELLETSTRAAGKITAKVIQAQEGLESIQQTAEGGAKLSEQTARELAQSVAAIRETAQSVTAAKETAAAAEKMVRDARENLDAQFEAAEGVLSEIQAQGKVVGGAVEQTLQQQQAAAQSLRQAEENLTQFHALFERGRQATEQLEQHAQAGDELKACVAQTFDQAQQRLEQIEDEASQAAAAIREAKDQALRGARAAVDEAERLQRQFAQSLSDHREAARDAVAALRADQAIGTDLLGRTQQDLETLAGEITRIGELRTAAGDAEGEVRQKLDQAGSMVNELKTVLAASSEVKSQIDGHLAESASGRVRLENMVRDTAIAVEDLRLKQDRAVNAVRGEAEAAEVQRKASETAIGEQLDAAGVLVADLQARKETADALLAEIRQQRDTAHTAAQASSEARVAMAQATGEVQSTLLEARRAVTDISGLLARGTESRLKIDAELATATDAGGRADKIRRELGEFFDYARLQDEAMVAAGKQSQQFITDLRRDGQEALAALTQQNTELKAQAEKLQQELEDLFGAAADGGLYHQFDELAQQSAPRRDKWLRLMVVGGTGGGVLLATVSSILAMFSAWAAGAALAVGLVPLGFFMYLCVSQYTAERRAESEHQYRAAVSRSLAAYRKLLVTMQAEGIADSAYVDRMLSALFGGPTQPTSNTDAPDVALDHREKCHMGQPDNPQISALCHKEKPKAIKTTPA